MKNGLPMVLNRIKLFLELVKFEHTIFAIPFAYLGAILAKGGVPHIYYWFWITLAMVGARTSGMALNRLIDRRIDAQNPRTQNRALPQGLIKIAQVRVLVVLFFFLLLLSAYQLNLLCLLLSPIAVLMLVGYSYLKRFTWACHLVLGAILGCAPIGGWIAIRPEISLLPLILGLSVMCWTAGFDIIYATQDMGFDKQVGLFSIPTAFGLKKALFISAVLHLLTVIGLGYVGFLAESGVYYWIGFGLTTGLLIYEHSIISPTDFSRVNQAFFTINGLVSIILFFAALVDVGVG
jgi:4-hydroxybenzoate polyprenyltransferase